MRSRKVVVMFNSRKFVATVVITAAVAVSSVTPAYAASYSCDTATESFFSGTTDQGNNSGNAGNNTSNNSGSSSSAGTNGATEDFNKPGSSTPSDNQKPSDSSNGTADSKKDESKTDSSNSANGNQTSDKTNSGSDNVNSSTSAPTTTPTYVYVTVPSTSTTTTVTPSDSAPSLDEKVVSDGVPASVKKNWAYKLNDSKRLICLQKYLGTAKKVSVPGTIKVNGKNYEVILAKKAFYGNTKITSVSINKKVRTAKGSAYKLFYGCTNLRTVKGLPWDLTSMNKTFMGCKNLKSVSGIPATVINANYAFSGCKKLQSAKLTSNLKNAYAVFNGCKSLKTVKGISAKRAGEIKGFYRGVSKKVVK